VLLQTLRDRPGDRTVEVVQTMAAALERAGERKLAGTVLLEAAQLQTESEAALRMARRARDLAPRDASTNSFLRTILLAHSPPDSPELEKVTIDLLDALLEADLTPTALEIIDDARATGTIRPQILVREVRARQKARDSAGAVQTLLELADTYEALGDRVHTIETLESILRIDRSLTDVKKRLSLMRQTRIGRIVRLVAAILCVGLLGGMGIVLWRQNAHDHNVKQADTEVGALLDAGDRAGARERWQHWAAALGECEAVVDLRSRVDFADAAEHTRVEKLRRRRIADRLTEAGNALTAGDVALSMSIYRELWAEPELQREVAEAAAARLEALLNTVEQTAKSIAHGLPPEPSTLIDRRDLDANRQDLRAICPPDLLAFFEGLERATDDLPQFLPAAQRERVATLLPQTRPLFAHAAHLTKAYEEAMHRNEHERRLDPMFKAAVEREAAFDFAGALDLYQQLERAPAGDAQLKVHFGERVARNTKIRQGMVAIEAATANADFTTAREQFRALQTAFPDVPFARLVRLPLRIDSYPPGATVTCNGTEVGTTPLALSYVPAVDNKVTARMPGFLAAATVVTGDTVGHWIGHLVLAPARTLTFEHAVENAPSVDAAGDLYFTDRGGLVSSLASQDGKVRWQFATNDLSGYLSRAFLRDSLVFVASLDGELRALERASGKLAWSLPDLPTEASPTLIDKYLVVATTDARLHCIDVDTRTVLHVELPEPAHGEILAGGSTVVCVGDRGTISAFTLPTLAPAWQRNLAGMQGLWGSLAGGRLLLTDDRGRVRCLEVATGVVLWSFDLDVEVMGAPLAADQHVLLVTPDRIERLDLASGGRREPIPSLEAAWVGSMLKVSGRLVVPVTGGALQVLDQTTGAPLYRLQSSRRGGRCGVRDDRLFVMQADRTVDCFPQLR
jgi:outer membrane protein assembly factor BamB/tetratricopeptide (TPR) repeat protein